MLKNRAQKGKYSYNSKIIIEQNFIFPFLTLHSEITVSETLIHTQRPSAAQCCHLPKGNMVN